MRFAREVLFLTKSQNLAREKKSYIFNKISKFLVRKGFIMYKISWQNILFLNVLDSFPPNNGQKTQIFLGDFGAPKKSARFPREILFLTKS